MKVFLLRHGETEYNKVGLTQDVNNDIDITREAKLELTQKRDELIKHLVEANCTAALCSTMLRAKHTLQHLILAQDCPINIVRYDTCLNEVDFGEFGSQHDKTFVNSNNLTMQDCRLQIVDCLSAYVSQHKTIHAFDDIYMHYAGGESIVSIQERCKNILTLIKYFANRNHDSILIVGHNRLFRHLLVELDVWQPERMFENKLPHAKLFYACDVTV